MVTASHASSDAPTLTADALPHLAGDALAAAAELALKSKLQAVMVVTGSELQLACASRAGTVENRRARGLACPAPPMVGKNVAALP